MKKIHALLCACLALLASCDKLKEIEGLPAGKWFASVRNEVLGTTREYGYEFMEDGRTVICHESLADGQMKYNRFELKYVSGDTWMIGPVTYEIKVSGDSMTLTRKDDSSQIQLKKVAQFSWGSK